MCDAHCYFPGMPPFILQALLQVLIQAYYSFSVLDNDFSFARQLEISLPADKNGNPKLLLQLPDMLAGSRLGKRKLLRRLVKLFSSLTVRRVTSLGSIMECLLINFHNEIVINHNLPLWFSLI